MNIDNKVSIIIDVDQLFEINDQDVQSMINGDIYRIDGLYIKALKIFRSNQNYQLTHLIRNKSESLSYWMNDFQCTNDPMSILIFLRYAKVALRQYL